MMTQDMPDADELFRQLDEQIRLLEENRERIARIEGRARTRDGMVGVRVNSTGHLVEVLLSPATAAVSREWLGRTIVDLARHAARQVADQIDTHYTGIHAARRRIVEQIAADAPADAQRLRRVADSVRPARPVQRPAGDDPDSPTRTWLQPP